MPFVIVEMWEGRTVEQKRKLVRARRSYAIRVVADGVIGRAGDEPGKRHYRVVIR